MKSSANLNPQPSSMFSKVGSSGSPDLQLPSLLSKVGSSATAKQQLSSTFATAGSSANLKPQLSAPFFKMGCRSTAKPQLLPSFLNMGCTLNGLLCVISLVVFAILMQSVGCSAENGSGGQRVWCIAKPSADEKSLLTNINYACSQPGVDCGIISQGCPCFLPNTMASHASVAMNLYYQHHGRNFWNCFFNGTGLLVFSDPSFGSCIYPFQ